MVSQAIGTTTDDARTGRYRAIERSLWDHYGLAPSERFIELDSPAVRLRVQELGSGEPILFVHGSGPPGAGSVWAPLVRELEGFRCLVLDLPGDGLSSAIDHDGRGYPTLVADAIDGVLATLGVERVHVISWSFGGVWALRLALRQPSRVSRIVNMGFSPIWPDIRPPASIRLQATPIGSVMLRMPVTARVVRSLLRNVVGHAASLDAGRIPDEMIDWIVALMRDTNTMRNDLSWLSALIGWRGARPGLTFEPADIAAIRQPLLYVYGTADWDGIVEVADRVTTLLPRAEVRVVQDGGHVPWLDDPGGIASDVRRFLRA
jgi:pimeloyl-ACP methyl ester carboxylesterase